MRPDIDFLIDSSVLKSYRDGDENARRLIYKAIDGDASVGICSYSLTMLWGSPYFDRKSEIGFTSLLEFLKVIDFDIESAMNTGHLLRQSALSEDGGFPTEFLECAIVESAALFSGCPVVTESDVRIGNDSSVYINIGDVLFDQT